MKALKILAVIAGLAIIAGLSLNQWLLHQRWQQLSNTNSPSPLDTGDAEPAAARLRQAEERLNDARMELQMAQQKLSQAGAQISQLNQRLQQLEGGPGRILDLGTGRRPRPADRLVEPPGLPRDSVKRGWGPEQAAGEPDTHQAGDISTAWAPLEQDAGEEWLKLDYENTVDIAEIRVRETHNPGAVSKVTALLANGTEVTLWEGVEPKAEAPVEMSFTVPSTVNAKTVKVYLDTKRVPGWNEIDAVELIGRDGSHQWAKSASASSTYAEPRRSFPAERLIEETRRL